jgi:hypothetical protein
VHVRVAGWGWSCRKVGVGPAGRHRLTGMAEETELLRSTEGFAPQLAAAVVLGGLAWWFGQPERMWLGLSGRTWMAAAIAVPIIHQLFAGAGWRLELLHRWFTRRFGAHGLRVCGAVFLPQSFVAGPILSYARLLGTSAAIEVTAM